MVGSTKKKRTHKRKQARDTTKTAQVSLAKDKNISIDDSPEPNLQQKQNVHSTKEVVQEEDTPLSEDSSKEADQEDEPVAQESAVDPRGHKKTRGLTKMKDIAVEPGSRVHVEFTDKGEPCGAGSVSLSSYLGPLVREHVPVTLNDWRKLGDDIKVILWKSIQARFDLDQEWQKAIVFKSMGCIWRASKSRLVSQIQAAKNKEERLRLQPKNIQNRAEWRKFVRAKTSTAFKAVSEKYRAIRRKQIPHTCSRKGMARLAEEMKKNSADPSSISRVKVWIRSRTKKDGKPVNTQVLETIEKLNEMEGVSTSSSTTSVRDDALSKVLGQDKPGRLRGMGRGMTITKLAFFQTKDKYVAKMQEEQNNMQDRINHLENLVNKLVKDKISGEEDKTFAASVNTNSKKTCKLLDWSGTEETVAEGYWISSDPKELVNQIPLGPNAMKVWIEIPNKLDAFLWRPTSTMTCIQQAQGKTIAWPAERVIIQMDDQSEEQDNMSGSSSKYTSTRKCKLFDWSGKDEIVAEGRWESCDPKELVNGIPLGPKAFSIWVDIPKNHEAFLWRPTSDMTCIEDAVNSIIAWPANKVVLEKITELAVDNATSPSSVNTNSNKRCKLLDANGSGQTVAEGRWSSSDPNQLVHFVPLGPNAVRVWVDTLKVPTASLWRPTSELEFIEDAIGTTVAWPADKVVML